jgi:hypothetical protein
MAKTRYDAMTPIEKEDDRGEKKTYWTKLGAAWRNDENESISIFLDALPMNGKIVLMIPKPREGTR